MDLHIGPICRALTRHRARTLLALSMTVLTFAIVVNCLQIIRDTRDELTRSSGVDDDHLVYVDIDNFDPDLRERPAVIDRIKRDLGTLRGVPGVVSATNTHFKPWRGGGSSSTVRPLGTDRDMVRAQNYPAGPELADTLGVTIVGTSLTQREVDDDTAGESASNSAGVIVSRSLADKLFPDGEALGKLVELSRYVIRIDGIIDGLYNPYAWGIEEDIMFYPGYRGNTAGSSFLVRVDDRLLDELAAIETALLTANDRRAVRVSTISETRWDFDASNRLVTRSLGLVIVLMVFVSAVSIVGLTASSVAARRHEIGTRRALGASAGAILRHFLLENAALTAAGVALGLGAAYGLNVLLVSGLGAPRLELPWVGAAVLVVAIANMLAALDPARRASRIPPAVATRAR